MCVCGIGSKQHTGVSKANSASSHIWLKTKLRLDPESLERESRCIDGSIFTPTPSSKVESVIFVMFLKERRTFLLSKAAFM